MAGRVNDVEAAAGTTLTLFVVGESPRSMRARRNLQRTMAEMDLDRTTVRMVDVLVDPAETVSQSIFATPALVLDDGSERQVLIGDLSEDAALRELLGRLE